ncbi:MAG: putative rane protein [Gemmatimonadetes bacterium]|nr:putative rane protein [Gemmatimonadota bacterium]
MDAWRATLATTRKRYSSLVLATLVSALASIVMVVTLMTNTPVVSPLPLIALFQIAVVGCMLAAREEISRKVDELSVLADSDPATGCLNRRGFARVLESTLISARFAKQDIALLSLDLDHFKQINDRFGHNVGDVVISEVAATLADMVGNDGVVARMGGEEFSVLLLSADAECAGVMAERMLARLRCQDICGTCAGTHVTMSVGIAAERIASTADGAALRARADEALYIAKRTGRNRVMLWAPGVRSNSTPAAAAAQIARPARWMGMRSDRQIV